MSENSNTTNEGVIEFENLEDLDDIGDDRAEYLRAAGYGSIEVLRGASEVELANVENIGEDLARTIKRQVGSRNLEDATRTIYTTQVTPEEWTVTPREAAYLADLSGLDADDLAWTPAADLQDRLNNRIDPSLLGFRTVCGRVVKKNPRTGNLEPVPNATVHVEDTECSFLGFFPPQSSLGWLFPTFSRTETIATVQTNACGRFCVYVPRWEIDRVLRFRRDRVCLPELVKPWLRDILENRDILPGQPEFPQPRPRPDPRPWPQPQPRPDPFPPDFDEPATFDHLRDLFDDEIANRLFEASDELTFGQSTTATNDLLTQPAFDEFEPPLPADIRAGELPEGIEALGDFENPHEALGERTGRDFVRLEESHREAFHPNEYVGPFLRCQTITVPEWVPLLDVPDITFKVTQDVDGDGNEEIIYDEGFFDVRWDAHPVPDPTLVADGSARSTPTCDGPDVDTGTCDPPEIVTAGLMPLRSRFHDDSTGYALRPNRPRKSGSPGGSNRGTSQAPYANTVQFHGCVRTTNAEYYRLTYSYKGNGWQPFTGIEWWAPRFNQPPVRFKSDPNGWYDIRPKSDLVFEHWLLNWNTRGYPDGPYEVNIEIADSSKNVIDSGTPFAFVIDNDDPHVEWDLFVKNSGTSTWDELSKTCPVIRRGETETVELKMDYVASDDHFRDVKVVAGGCGPDPTKPSSVPQSEYAHWYTKPSDNSHSGEARFDIPSSYPDGTYTIAVKANSRTFNPSGGRGGPGDNWKYDAVYSRSHPRQHISVITK